MNRVVITGMGAVTPIGNNVEDFWQNSKNGNSGIDFIKSISSNSYGTSILCSNFIILPFNIVSKFISVSDKSKNIFLFSSNIG